MADALYQQAGNPTRLSRSLANILTNLVESGDGTSHGDANSAAAVICGKILWRYSSPRNEDHETRQQPRRPTPCEEEVLEVLDSARSDAVGGLHIPGLRGGPFIYLRLLLEIAAASNLDASTGYLTALELEHVETLDSLALHVAREHYGALSNQDLWFLTYRGAADAYVRVNMAPGNYLPRWRQFMTDVIRTRSCEIRVRRALQSARFPEEIMVLVLNALLDIESLPRESEYSIVWKTKKPKKPPGYFKDNNEPAGVYSRQQGHVAWDPINRKYGLVWLNHFGASIFYGYEPILLFDFAEDRWLANEKHLAMFGRLIASREDMNEYLETRRAS